MLLGVGLIILFGISAATVEVTRVFKMVDQLPLMLLIETALFVLICICMAVWRIVKRDKRNQSADTIQQTNIEN